MEGDFNFPAYAVTKDSLRVVEIGIRLGEIYLNLSVRDKPGGNIHFTPPFFTYLVGYEQAGRNVLPGVFFTVGSLTTESTIPIPIANPCAKGYIGL